MVHKLTLLFKNVYSLGHNIPKKDKLGLYLKIETACLESLKLSIAAAFSPKEQKAPSLQKVRIEIEIAKRLIRLATELQIIKSQNFLQIIAELQEISKMASGWLKYVERKEPTKDSFL